MQCRLQSIRTAIVNPVGEHDQQSRAGIHVRITVEGHVDAFVARLLHECEHVGRATPRREALVEVCDMATDTGAAANLDSLAKRIKKPISEAIAHVRVDRKSTRLNSSHQIISYAVLRLKKKTY